MADNSIIESLKKQLTLLETENAKLLQERDIARQLEANLREQVENLRELAEKLLSTPTKT